MALPTYTLRPRTNRTRPVEIIDPTKPFLDRNPVLLDRIAFYCVKELHRQIPADMAIMGGKAFDYYMNRIESKDTDLEVCRREGSHEDLVRSILHVLMYLCKSIGPLCTANELSLPLYFPIDPGQSLPASLQIAEGPPALADFLATHGLGNGTRLNVEPNFPFCIFILPEARRGTHTLLQLRSRVQEGITGAYPRYPGFLDIVVKREGTCYARDPALVPYIDGRLPYINVLLLLLSQLELIGNLPEGDTKAAKIARLQAFWRIAGPRMESLGYSKEQHDALLVSGHGILTRTRRARKTRRQNPHR